MTDMLPISVVESEEFKELEKKVFEEKRDELNVKMTGADKWAQSADKNYITATCHFISADWEMRPVCSSAQN